MAEHARLVDGGLADHHRPLELGEVAPDGCARSGDEDVSLLEHDVARERVRDGGVAADLPAVARVRTGREDALSPVDRPDRVEHGERRLVRSARRDLGLGDTGSCVALQQRVREIAPAHALADQPDLGLRLDRHLLLDLLDDAYDGRSRQLAESRAAIAEDPRIPVLVGADLPLYTHRLERCRDRHFRPGVARKFEVVLDAVERRVALRVLDLEARDDERALSVRVEDEGDRPLRRHEGEARVVEDVVRVEENDARQPLFGKSLEQCVAPRSVLVRRDRDRRQHDRAA